MSNAVKAFDGDRFGGYLILWGDQRHRDITGEYFTKATAEIDNVIGTLGKLPVLYHHAADPAVKSTVIGVIDTMRKDDTGVWVEGQATKAEQYRKMVLPLVEQGLLAWSSGTFPKAKEVKSNGEITRWPVIEGSMTPTPAEFRMIVDHPIQVVKAAFDEVGLDGTTLDTYEAQAALVKSVALERERIAVLELDEFSKSLANTRVNVQSADGVWKETDHPRYPEGHPKGGQFMPKIGTEAFAKEYFKLLDKDFENPDYGASMAGLVEGAQASAATVGADASPTSDYVRKRVGQHVLDRANWKYSNLNRFMYSQGVKPETLASLRQDWAKQKTDAYFAQLAHYEEQQRDISNQMMAERKRVYGR